MIKNLREGNIYKLDDIIKELTQEKMDKFFFYFL